MTNDTIFKIFKNYKWLKQENDYILIEHNNRYQFCIYICSDSFYKKIQTIYHIQKRKNCKINNSSSCYLYMYIPKSLITQKLRQITINLLNDLFN